MIEIGAGGGTNAALYAQRGARVTLFGRSATAMAQAGELFAAHGLEAAPVEADAFALPSELAGAFDVSISFGLCDHFRGPRRVGIVRARTDLIRQGGVATLGVPNRHAPVYRRWTATLRATGS